MVFDPITKNSDLKNSVEPKRKKAKIDESETVLGEHYHPPPDFNFPIKKMGKGKNARGRSCHYSWLKKWPFLHYDLSKDSLFCYPCHIVFHQQKLLTNMGEKTFIYGNGFSDWQKATGDSEKYLGKIPKHERSKCHKEAMTKFSEISKTKDIGTVLSDNYREDQKENRKCLMIIIETLRVFARQSMALRGNGENSDFYQFLLVEGRRNPGFGKWLQKTTCKYTSHDIQNEIIEIMALEILREVIQSVKNANFYSIMADETQDVSNTEQLSFFVRSVGENFEVFEYFIGLHEIENTFANHLVAVIKNILLACNFDFNKIRGQCYDKAGSMSGHKTGVKAQILIENDKALWIHCYNHGLNLAVLDTMNKITLFKNAISYCEELILLIKKSPKRETLLKNIKMEEFDNSPGIKSFCKTRWTTKGQKANVSLENTGFNVHKLLVKYKQR